MSTPKPRETYQQNGDKALVRVRDFVENKTDNGDSIVMFYYVEGPRKLKDYSMYLGEFLSKFTPILGPDELDAEWKRLADESNPDSTDMARSLNARFHQICESYEEALGELRDLARMSLAEKAEAERRAALKDAGNPYELSIKVDGFQVHVNKVGGGTLNKTYQGNWEVTIDGRYEKEVLITGLPKTHYEVAKMAVEFLSEPDPSADADA